MASHDSAPPQDCKADSNRVFETRVLSIQSHTVYGHVGNKSAVFPLQTLGIEVDFINSVQFSNHTGYPSWTGESLDGEQLWTLVEGLIANKLIMHTHLLTGYMRSPAMLRCILRILDELRKVNPDVVYVCDPVMGDDGRLYVPPELVPVYRDEVVPRASILTPNQFEAELLSGITIRGEADAVAAIDRLHDLGPPCVVLTSTAFGDAGHMTLLASRRPRPPAGGGPGGPAERYRILIPRLRASFTGTGDLVSALVLAWMARTGDLRVAVENATATVQAVLRRTVAWSAAGRGPEPSLPGPGAADEPVAELRRRELRLIQSRDDIAAPHVPDDLRAQPI